MSGPASSRERLRLNPAQEAQVDGDGLILALPPWNRTLRATAFQHGLLRCFESPCTIDEVLQQKPFQREASRAFLAEARAQGFLVPLDEAGGLLLPPCVEPHLRFAHAPPFRVEAPSRFVVLGAPLDKDVTGRSGARFGPHAIRDGAGSARFHVDPLTRQPLGFHDFASGRALLKRVSLADAGDVLVEPGEPAARTRARLTQVVREVVQAGGVPVVLGGDHSITRATLAALDAEGPPLHVVHLDAHSDLGEVQTAAGLHHGNVMSVVLDELPHVAGIHQLGLRGIYDAPTHTAHPRVRQLGMDALRAGGAAAFLDAIPAGARCWLSLDIDVVDPAFAPSTGTPVVGGLLPHELKELLVIATQRCRFVGGELVEVGEALGPADGTGSLAAACIFTFLQGIVEGAERPWPTRRSSPTQKSSPRSSRSRSRRRSPSP